MAGYRLARALGVGGFGAVFEGTSLATSEAVAIKIAAPGSHEAVAQLRREASLLQLLAGHIAPRLVEDGSSTVPAPFVAMELLRGPTLATALSTYTTTSPEERVAWSRCMVEAVAALHEVGVVHGDLKPENILLPAHAAAPARLVDFGVARILEIEAATFEARLLLSTEGVRGEAGTPAYMAPELVGGLASSDARSDIYALGVLLFEIATGAAPFFGDETVVREGHRSRRVPRRALEAASRTLVDAIMRCLAKDPAERFASARDLVDALASVAGGRRAPTPVPERSPTPPQAVQAGDVSPAGARRARAALLACPADVDVNRLQNVVDRHGGELAARQGGSLVFAWTSGGRMHPVERALAAAREVVATSLCPTALVDHATVSVLLRPGGQRVLGGSGIARAASVLASILESGVHLSPNAAAVSPFAGAAGSALLPPLTRTFALEDLEVADLTRASDALVGRDALLDTIVTAAIRGAGGQPTLLTALAAPGLGKTAVARAALERIRASVEGVEVMLVAGRIGEHEVLRTMAALGSDVPSPPQSAALIAYALGTAALDAPELRPLRLAPGALRAALARALAARLARRSMPLVLLVDDAHLLAHVVLDALELVTAAEARVAIIVLADPSLERARTAWGTRAASHERVVLAPLADADAVTLCRTLLRPADDVPVDAVARLCARAAGNPALLTELIVGLKRVGAVRRRTRGAGFYLATDQIEHLPEQSPVEWLAEQAALSLPEEVRTFGGLAATLGMRPVLHEIRAALGELDAAGLESTFPLDAMAGFQRLGAEGIVTAAADGAFELRTEFHRRALLERISPGLRAALEDAAFRAVRRTAVPSDVGALERLAGHAARSARLADAEALLARVVDAYAIVHDETGVERACTRFAEVLALQGRTIPPGALRRRAVARHRLGRYEDADTDFHRARELAREAGDASEEALVLLEHATALDWMNEFARSSAAATEAFAVVGARGLAPELALAAGRQAHRAGNPRAAIEPLERAVHAAKIEPERHYEALVAALVLLGGIYPAAGRIADAEAALDEAFMLATSHGDATHRAIASYNRVFLALGRRDYAAAKETLLAALASALDAGQPELIFLASVALALITMQNGELTDARAHLATARRAATLHGGRNERIGVASLAGRLAYFEGEPDEAAAALAEIHAEQEAARAAGDADPMSAEQHHEVDALALALEGGDDAAWEALAAAVHEVDVSGDLVGLLVLRAEVARRRGDAARSREVLVAALAIAERVPNVQRDRLRRLLAEV